MSEKRILIASLLKPISDTRMYEKLGLSLSKLRNAWVHVCGFQAPLPAAAPENIVFHPLFTFRRLSLGRLAAQFKFFKLLLKLKPDLLIVCTHELLLASYFYSRLHKVKLVYDVQENYALNLRSQQNYGPQVKQLLATGIESMEKLVAPAVSHFILAEQSYAAELQFLGKRFTVLENKYKKPANYTLPQTPVLLQNAPLHLLYSGTIAEEYGIFEAIGFAEKLHQNDNRTTLTIIGYCANHKTLQQVQEQVKNKPFIQLTGGDKLVPHAQIIETMKHGHVGLLPYRPNVSTARCVPTKLFEYMAYALPILISPNPLWEELVQRRAAGFSFNFEDTNAADNWLNLRQNTFYTLGVPEDIFWEREEKELLKLANSLLTQNQTCKN